MTRPPRIAVLGSLHMDIVVQAARQPVLGETLAGQSWRPSPGGKGLNQAVHAARHGAAVSMFGRLGDDDFAAPLLAYMAANHVDAAGVRSTSDAGTGMSVAIIEQSGDYGAVIVSGANQHIDDDDIQAVADSGADILLLQYEISIGRLAAAARAGRDTGAIVVLNAAPATDAPPGLLDAVDLLVANEIEAEMLTGIPIAGPAEAERALGVLLRQVPAAIVTLGPGGLVFATRGEPPRHIPGHPALVVDTHGAGDALIGALASRLGAGDSLADAARYANAAGALMVMARGADPAPAAPERVYQLISASAAAG